MKYWFRKPEKENEAPLFAAKLAGVTVFADLHVLTRGALGMLLALLLPGLFGRGGAGRGRTARRKGAFGGRSGAFGGRGRR